MPFELRETVFSMKKFVDAHEEFWAEVVSQHGLVKTKLSDLIAWEFIDKAMAIDWDVSFSLAKVKNAGFDTFPSNEQVFLEVIKSLYQANIIPDAGQMPDRVALKG